MLRYQNISLPFDITTGNKTLQTSELLTLKCSLEGRLFFCSFLFFFLLPSLPSTLSGLIMRYSKISIQKQGGGQVVCFVSANQSIMQMN